MSKAIDFFKGFWKRYSKARINSLAASLAFHSLLSLVPLITLGFWYLNNAGITQKWVDIARNWIFSHFDFAEGSRVLDIFNSLTTQTQSSSWGWIGLAIFIYTSINLLMSIGDALDQVLKAREVEINLSQGVIITLLRRLLFLILLPLVLILSSALMGWVRSDSWLKVLFEMDTVGRYFALPLPWSLDLLAFFLLYHYVPNTRVSPSQALRAALFATPFFILGKYAMSHYSAYALTTQKIYGAFAVIPMLMLWTYWAWIIVLGGALFVRENFDKMSRKPQPKKVTSTTKAPEALS
jgi:membrane protein